MIGGEIAGVIRATEISSGHSIDGGIAGPPERNTVEPWCTEFHQTTE